jgi:hypothetical protein
MRVLRTLIEQARTLIDDDRLLFELRLVRCAPVRWPYDGPTGTSHGICRCDHSAHQILRPGNRA